MGYEIDMCDYHDEQEHRYKNKSYFLFTVIGGKNFITAVGVSMRTILWNYICWVLAGKPNNWRVNGK